MQPIPRPYRKAIFVCINEREAGKAACGNRGSRALFQWLKQKMRDRGLNKEIRVSRTKCLGLCEYGPNIAVYPEGSWYTAVKEEDLPEILRKHVPEEESAAPIRGDRVGIAVKDLEKAKRFFEEILGAKFRPTEEVPGQGFRYAPFEVGGFSLELLSPGGGDGVIRRFIEGRGEGVHHLSFRVDDLDATVRGLEEKGIRIAARIDYPPEITFEGCHWREAFLHPKDSFGVLVHFAEVKKILPESKEEANKAPDDSRERSKREGEGSG